MGAEEAAQPKGDLMAANIHFGDIAIADVIAVVISWIVAKIVSRGRMMPPPK